LVILHPSLNLDVLLLSHLSSRIYSSLSSFEKKFVSILFKFVWVGLGWITERSHSFLWKLRLSSHSYLSSAVQHTFDCWIPISHFTFDSNLFCDPPIHYFLSLVYDKSFKRGQKLHCIITGYTAPYKLMYLIFLSSLVLLLINLEKNIFIYWEYWINLNITTIKWTECLWMNFMLNIGEKQHLN
jgi:hypothetical protein